MQRMESEHVRRLLKLYFIMGSVNCLKTPLETLVEAMDGGITLFQYREKGSTAFTGQAYVELAQVLQQKCRERKIPFIVNDDIDLAVALDADGVHVGQKDAPARSIRERLGAHKIIGVSAHNLKEAQQAIADGADYLGVGPVYPTSSKDDAEAVQGTGVIEELRRSGLTIPLVGIGGITAANAQPVIQAGADGISVISAIAGAADIRGAARNFLRVIQQ